MGQHKTGVQSRGALFLMLGGLLAGAAVAAGAGKPSSAWTDNFTNGIDKSFWVIANGGAPGYIPDVHKGYYQPNDVSVANGIVTLRLTQEYGTVDTNPSGVISRGALLYSRKTYGYGTYQWRMRMSSTATSPTGAGTPVPGSVSAGFNYVNNSQTEIDFEFSALNPSWLFLVNWLNPTPSSDPTDYNETYTTLTFDSTRAFHTYKYVWQPGQITYYIDDVLKGSHTSNVPTAPAYFMINHWGTNSDNWGGAATVGTTRYAYIDWVSYTPLP